MSMITPNIDTGSKVHIYTQIYQYIRQEIENGSLPFKTKLPSTRLLATHLQVSRNTVDMAYGQLMDEGYIESSPKRGYFVCDIENMMPPTVNDSAATGVGSVHMPASLNNAAASFAAAPTCTNTDAAGENTYVFSPYGVDLECFPFGTWRKIAKDIFYDDRNSALFESGNPQGDEDLRAAITGYLHQSRGVRCHADQMIIGAGTEYLLILLSQLLGDDAVYAVEDPSYKQAGNILSCLGKKICPLSLDANGLSIKQLKKSGATAAYVTPSHHFPLGNIMPIKRRLELLSWAAGHKSRYIIEDDYDSEFRYKGKPVPSLQGIDVNEKVIYLGTFSKAVAPSIRMSYMVLPPALLALYKKKLSFYSSTVARTEQKQMTEFIVRGHFERHLNRMRNIYKAKRDYILQLLAPYSDDIEISGETSGLHMLLTFKDGRSAKDILNIARTHHIILFDLSDYYINPAHMTMQNTVILGYGALSGAQLEIQMPLLINALFGQKGA